MRSLLVVVVLGVLALFCLALPALAVETPGPTPVPTAIASPAEAGTSPQATATPWQYSPAPTPTEEPLKAGGGDVPIMPYLIQLIVVTALVGVAGYFSLKLIRDKVPSLGLGLGASKQIRIVDKVVVDPKRLVFLVGVGERYFLVAATENSASPIAELSKADLGGEFAQLVEQEKHRGETS